MNSNVELTKLYEQDQADRRGSLDELAPGIERRDAERRERVLELLAQGALRAADDYFHAAMIFQHGDSVADIDRARELALQAIALDPGHQTARWLAAASEDRALMYRGEPQRWGTQFKRVDGRWRLWPVDATTTDEERASRGVPSLAEQEARERALNGE
jgi:hypothetical protein